MMKTKNALFCLTLFPNFSTLSGLGPSLFIPEQKGKKTQLISYFSWAHTHMLHKQA